MWREYRRKIVLLVRALAIAGCTNDSADTTTTTVQLTTTTTAAPTTTTTTTTNEAAATTTSAQPSQTIGSSEAFSELVDEGLAFSSLAYGEEIDRSIVPDLAALNVVAATEAIFEFEAQISTLAPAARWVDVFTFPGSPAYSEYLRSFRSLEENGLRAEIAGDGYVVSDVRVANEAEVSGLSQETLGEAPEGSFVLRITSSSGPIRFVNGAGEVHSSSDGWSNRTRQVIVAPSESGWKLFWTEGL